MPLPPAPHAPVGGGAALARIDAATRTGYILGYAPANPVMDGKYRKVEVRVNRPGLEVVYRHGYTAEPDVAPLDLRALRLSETAATDFLPDEIKVRAEAAVEPAASGGQQVKVSVTIDASQLTLTEQDGRHEGLIDLWILCGDAKQQVVGTLKQQMTIGLDAAHYAKALAGGIPYTATIPVTGAPTHVKVLVYDYAADLLGAATVTLKR
jgi:hypothetical protein